MFGVNDNTQSPVTDRITMALHTAIGQATNQDSTNRGATMVEYALLLVLVLLVAFFTVQIFGESLVGLFDASGNTLDSAPNVNPEG